MITPNLKFVSYLGGSAGDMFVSSLNGNILNFKGVIASNKNSLKPYENLIEANPAELEQVLQKLAPGYVSTHLFSLLVEKGADVINVVITDPVIQEKIILRQMHLQRLEINVAPNETFFKIIKQRCTNQQFKSAAEVWLWFAQQRWQDAMSQRLLDPRTRQLNFNKLFDPTFVDSLKEQGWQHNINILQTNHALWLEKNQNFSKEKTIESMSLKLKSMDWLQKSGIIKFK